MVFTAYSNSPDGKKDFTKIKPNPNLYYSSLVGGNNILSMEDTGFKVATWAGTVIPHSELKKILKTGKTYHISYDFELLSLTEGTIPGVQTNHGSLLLYSGKTNLTTYPTVLLTQYTENANIELINSMSVGDIAHNTKTFTLPDSFNDPYSDFRILAYTRRSTTDGNTLVKTEDGRFSNIKIEESETGETVFLQNPIDNLANSYMRYIGTSETDSDNPSDYTWKLADNQEVVHTLKPDNVTNKNAVYTLKDKEIANIELDNSGVVVSPNNYGKTSLKVASTDNRVSKEIPVNVTKTITLDQQDREFLSPYANQNKTLADIRSSGIVNLLKGTGDARQASVYSIRSNNATTYPVSYEDIAEANGIKYTRVRRAKLADGTWGDKIFSIYMVGAPVDTYGTENFLGTGYWFSFYLRSNYTLSIPGNSGKVLTVWEYTGGTTYNTSTLTEPVTLTPNTWQFVKVWVPSSETAQTSATSIRFVFATAELTDTQLANASLDFAKPMVSKEEPQYWLPAPEDAGVPHGQPNLINGTSKDWQEYTFNSWLPSSGVKWINPALLGLKVGDVLTAQVEIENPVDSGVPLFIEIKQQVADSKVGIVYGKGNQIASGTTGISIATFTVQNIDQNIQISNLVKNDATTEVVGAKARRLKLIKGDKTLMDEWTPSFNDFSANKYEFNPYYEIGETKITELQSDTGTTNTTKIVDTTAETQLVFDTVNTVKEHFPKEFKGLATEADILAKFSTIVQSITTTISYKGTSPKGNYAECGLLTKAGADSSKQTNTTANFSSTPIKITSDYSSYIQSDMTTKFFVRTNKTDGLTASSVTIKQPMQTIVVQPVENSNPEAVTVLTALPVA